MSMYFSSPHRSPRRVIGPSKPVCDECHAVGREVCSAHGLTSTKKRQTRKKAAPPSELICSACVTVIPFGKEQRDSGEIFCTHCFNQKMARLLIRRVRYLEGTLRRYRNSCDPSTQRQLETSVYRLRNDFKQFTEVREFLERWSND